MMHDSRNTFHMNWSWLELFIDWDKLAPLQFWVAQRFTAAID